MLQRLPLVHVALAGAATVAASGDLSFGTEQLRFVLSNSTQTHWGCLDALHIGGDPRPTKRGIFWQDAQSGQGATEVWQLTATACNASYPTATLVMNSCTATCERKYMVEHSESPGKSRAHMRWEKCSACDTTGGQTCANSLLTSGGVPATLNIDVIVDVVGGVSTWGATVGKQGAAGVCLQSFAMPDLRTLRFDPGRESLFVPYMFGAKGSHPQFPWGGLLPEVAGVRGVGPQDGSDRERTWMPNGWDRTMSWTAWFSAGPSAATAATAGVSTRRHDIGLYVGVHDPASRLKMMPAVAAPDYNKDLGSGPYAALRAVHVPDSFDDSSTANFTIPYEVVVASFRGGWWDAAQLYRNWALLNARWTRKGNLTTRTDIPSWLLRAPLWLRLSGNNPESTSTMAEINGVKESLGGDAVTDIGVHYYSWNTEHFDSHYPIYTAKPGFREAVGAMQTAHAGVTARVVPYTNGRIWDPSGPLQAVPDGATCNGRNGSAYHEVYGSKVPFSVMNPASKFMQDEWSTAVGNITTKYDTSGVYSDQISCSHAEACYDDNRTNASSWAAGSQRMLSEMARKMGPEKALISESQDQTMMADLHAFLSIYGWLGEMRCQTVLGWQAVYSGWTVNVGDIRYPPRPNTTSPGGSKLHFNATEAAAHRAMSAQNFCAGNVMGWYGGAVNWENWIGLPSEDMAYTRLLASTKVTSAKYLTFGRLWRQPEWASKPETMDLHDYGYMEHNASQSCPTSQVLAELWRADDGSFALITTNHAEVDLVLNVTVDVSEAGASDPVFVSVVKAMASRSVAVLPVSVPSQAALKLDDDLSVAPLASLFLPADMLMLRPYEQSLGGAPPPACPPHCTPPIPRYSEVNCTFQLMKVLSTTERIEDFNRSGSYICAPLSAAAKAGGGKGQLLLFFTGTSPSDNTLYIQTAATLGFHAIALSYNNEGAPNGQCSDYPSNQTIINDDCEFNVEEERLFGGNRSAALWKKRAEPYQLVDMPNSIMSRTELLLKFAATHALAGSQQWSSFLSSGKKAEPDAGAPVAPSGHAMDWGKIVLSGWSRGSAYPVHITKYFAAPRLVLFCGLEDYVGNRGPDSRPEPYIYRMKGLTPPENIFGVGGLHGGCCSNWMTNWGRTGLNLPGQSFADAKKDGAVFATTMHSVETLVKGARRVYLQGPKVGHGTPIYDAQIPRDATSGPVYTAVWEYLLTTKMAAGTGTIPEDTTPCCCIDSRMKQGLYAPRNCSKSVGAHCQAHLKLDDDFMGVNLKTNER